MAYYITNDGELCHFGIKGMHWGIRRYQNPDGSLTEAGRARYAQKEQALQFKQERWRSKQDKKAARKEARAVKIAARKEKHKKVKDMSDDELRERMSRVKMELDYGRMKSELDEMNRSKIGKLSEKIVFDGTATIARGFFEKLAADIRDTTTRRIEERQDEREERRKGLEEERQIRKEVRDEARQTRLADLQSARDENREIRREKRQDEREERREKRQDERDERRRDSEAFENMARSATTRKYAYRVFTTMDQADNITPEDISKATEAIRNIQAIERAMYGETMPGGQKGKRGGNK